MKKQRYSFRQKRAQTASELAIFGAILIFVLGLIIRYAVSFNYYQNQALSAMRLALKNSFTSGVIGDRANRIRASVLLIEDRKDVDFTSGEKFGPQSRIPYIATGSGSFTNKFFMDRKYGHNEHLPVMDVYINGQHFTFTTAGYPPPITIDIPYDCTNLPDTAPASYYVKESCFTNLEEPTDNCCAIRYTKIPNSDPRFDPTCDPCFDFNLDGVPDIAPEPFTCAEADEPGPECFRSNHSWQWHPVMMTTDNIALDLGKNTSIDVDKDLKEEQILEMVDEKGYTCNVDHGCRTHSVRIFGEKPFPLGTRRIKQTSVLDLGEGDMDFTYDTIDADNGVPRPGLTDEMRLYTFIDGEYFLIESGMLYEMLSEPDKKKYIRDASKEDRVDIIERTIQLSNDTGRLCRNGLPQQSDVEACGDCFIPKNRYKTCFEPNPSDSPGHPKLYVRSAISDKRGRKWITDISNDELFFAPGDDGPGPECLEVICEERSVENCCEDDCCSKCFNDEGVASGCVVWQSGGCEAGGICPSEPSYDCTGVVCGERPNNGTPCCENDCCSVCVDLDGIPVGCVEPTDPWRCNSNEICPWISYCGDGNCDTGENFLNCCQDCGSCPDGWCCSGFEDSYTCSQDCGGEPPSVCGDGSCDTDDGENFLNCCEDCGSCPDGWCCPEDETSETCSKDCGGEPTSVCGDGNCDPDENFLSCCLDCGSCPDGWCCVGFEDDISCFEDCGTDPPQECGDRECIPPENFLNCCQDCGSCPDGWCCPGNEDETSCPQDCGGTAPAECGNGNCDPDENFLSCCLDCGSCPDGWCCPENENSSNCPQDCGDTEPECGNGTCDEGENFLSCCQDCGRCPDGWCCPENENSSNCSSDCGGTPDDCGNGTCDTGENFLNCCQDCGRCPDGWCCSADEDEISCPQDCGDSQPGECGNGTCDTGENFLNCCQDCGRCPDGWCCSYNENESNCSQDCGGTAPAECGNGTCDTGENFLNCCQDCGSCPDGICCSEDEDEYNCAQDCGGTIEDLCGDGLCTGDENFLSCCQDCGSCPDGWCCPEDESPSNCPKDCPTCNNNGRCEVDSLGENSNNCCNDCGWIGDTICCPTKEDINNAPTDCCPEACGNSTCDSFICGEDIGNCPEDCS